MKFTPNDRKDWRSWLVKRHANESEIWLVFLKQHTKRPNLSYDDAVEEALCFGWIDGIKRSLDEDRYMHRFTPRKANSNWSKSNKQRVERMLAAGQMTDAGLESIEAAKENGRWNKPVEPQTEFSMSAELSEQLKMNKKAGAYFASLAPSYQREYIAWIATAKKPETGQRRLDETMALLVHGKKLGMR